MTPTLVNPSNHQELGLTDNLTGIEELTLVLSPVRQEDFEGVLQLRLGRMQGVQKGARVEWVREEESVTHRLGDCLYYVLGQEKSSSHKIKVLKEPVQVTDDEDGFLGSGNSHNKIKGQSSQESEVANSEEFEADASEEVDVDGFVENEDFTVDTDFEYGNGVEEEEEEWAGVLDICSSIVSIYYILVTFL